MFYQSNRLLNNEEPIIDTENSQMVEKKQPSSTYDRLIRLNCLDLLFNLACIGLAFLLCGAFFCLCATHLLTHLYGNHPIQLERILKTKQLERDMQLKAHAHELEKLRGVCPVDARVVDHICNPFGERLKNDIASTGNVRVMCLKKILNGTKKRFQQFELLINQAVVDVRRGEIIMEPQKRYNESQRLKIMAK